MELVSYFDLRGKDHHPDWDKDGPWIDGMGATDIKVGDTIIICFDFYNDNAISLRNSFGFEDIYQLYVKVTEISHFVNYDDSHQWYNMYYDGSISIGLRPIGVSIKDKYYDLDDNGRIIED